MDKKSPFYTASVAAVFYFITFIMLKYLLQTRIPDWSGALIGAVIFWVVIFVVHHLLNRRYAE